MKRQHLVELARLIGDLRGDLTPVRYQQLLADVSDLAARVNPAFSPERFREEAATRHVKQRGGSL